MTFRRSWINTQGFTAEHPLAKAIELLIAVTLLFAPLAFGTTEPWSEQIVIALTGLILVLFLMRYTFCPDANIVWHWAYVPVLCFVFLVGLQLLPLPTGVISILSPDTVTIKNELLGGLFSKDFSLDSTTISFYPHATHHDLRLVLAVVALFFVALNTFHTLTSIKRLLGYIAVIGGGIALLCLAQFITETDKIFWLFPSSYELANSGPFVNHSNFAQFMNLSIGGAVALLLVRVCESLGGHNTIESAEVIDFLGSREARTIWGLLAVFVFGVASIFVSLSRGGIVSLLLTAGFIVSLMSFGSSQKGRAKVIGLVVLVAFACILYIGFDAVYDRMATLSELDKAQGGREQIIKDIFTAWTRFPWFGTGLGTHSVVYPMFDRSMNPKIAGHAENEYAQAIEETGLIGFLFLAAFGVLVCRAFVYNIRHQDARIQAVSYGLGFGLMAILLHSFTDFGQHLPANAFLSAIFCALLFSMAHFGKPTEPQESAVYTQRRIPRVVLGVVAILAVGGSWTWMVLEADEARVAAAFWNKTSQVERHLEEVNWLGSDEEYIKLLSNAQAAVEAEPSNARMRHWLNVYRWHSISRNIDPNTGDLMLLPETVQFTRRIVEDLKQVCLLCPTFGPSHCVLGELQVQVLDDPNGADQIRTGYRLAPCDATVCLAAASLDVEAGHIQQATEKLSRAVELDANCFDEVVAMCLNDLHDPNLALNLADDDVRLLSRIANQLADWAPHDNSLYHRALAQIKAELEFLCQQPDVTSGLLASLARICIQDNEIEAAIAYYQKALDLDYGQIHWRYQLARLLASQNQIQDAIHQAEICLRLDRTFVAAQRLIEELAVKVPKEDH